MWKFRVCMALGLILLQGCIEFESQTIVWRHDTDRDELRMLMIYDGISAKSESDIDELRSVLMRPRTFFFSNWIFEYDRDEVFRQLKDLRAEQKVSPNETTALGIRLLKLLLKSVWVDNGAFYLNDENKLAAYQRVTIGNISTLVTLTNELVNTALIEEVLNASDMELGTSSEDVIRNAAYADHEWITLHEGEMRFRFPIAPDDHEEFMADNVEDEDWHQLIRAGLRHTYVNGVTEFVFGQPWASRYSMSLVVNEGSYEPNMLRYVEEEGLLEPHPDFDAIERRFVDRQLSF